MTWTVEMSVGPIQQFVGQSRRTRDLWGSSYLLSFLCAHAAVAAAKEGATLLQPDTNTNPFCLLVAQARDGEVAPGDVPAFASVPNHLVFRVDDDPERVVAAAREELLQTWRNVADCVWERFVDPHVELGDDTRKIWDRQVDSYWEIMWVAQEHAEPGLLARRKLIRDHQLPKEPGDKCMVMPSFQELSGHNRLTGKGREAQRKFWSGIRRRVGHLNLRPDERLCAIALIKRLYPLVAEKALRWKLDMVRWPSTLDLAAAPWMLGLPDSIGAKAGAYVEAVTENLSQDEPKHSSPVRKAGPYTDKVPAALHEFSRLHASYLYRNFVKDPRQCPLQDDEASTRQGLLNCLDALQDHKPPGGDEAVGAPPVFYALVLADGDRLGEVLSRLGREQVGEALAEFTDRVPKIVSDHDGFLVYAGGDDVLAMLPVSRALGYAEKLATTYQESFPQKIRATDNPPTLSVAVLFAHMTLALTVALREAHRLLDDVAKEGNGRASLAVEVLKRGGPSARWVSHWKRVDATGATDAVTALTDLVQELSGEMSSTLLYRMRRVLTTVTDWSNWQPGAVIKAPASIDLATLLQAEIRSSLDHRDGREQSDQREELPNQDRDREMREYAAQLASQVTALLHPAPGPYRASVGRAGQLDQAHLGLDALPLARFLATGGQEEGHEW